MCFESIIVTAILIIILLIFAFMLLIIALSIFRWLKTSSYQPPAIKIEDYTCPKCGSKDLELIGSRTIRCKKCGTIFTIQPETVEARWIMWPVFWWIPIIWPVPVKKEA
ncbi:MAG: hypothetical protein QXK78_02350 [Candidatus Bathyarchaeia archaeon]